MSFAVDPNWKPPAGLGYSSLRPVRLSVSGRLLAFLMLMCGIGALLAGTFLHKKSLAEQAVRDQLDGSGVLTEGTIERLWRSGGKDATPWVRYRFTANGREVIGSSRMPKRTYGTLNTGESLAVRYAAADPTINHPDAWPVNVTPEWLGLLVGGMLLGVVLLLVTVLRRQWLLLVEGRPAPGIVRKTRRSDKTVVVHYEFRLPNGAIQKGRGNTGRKSIPAEGTTVTVLYDPENPRRNGMYPFTLVQLEK